MSKSKIFRQALKIILLSLFFALIVNFLNPHGRSIFSKDEICTRSQTIESKKSIDWTSDDYKNDPYDTSAKPVKVEKSPNLTKEGYVKPQKVSLDMAKKFYDKNALFFDARHKESYDSGHVKGSVSLPYIDFMHFTPEERKEAMKKYNKDGIIICYCSGGECEISIDLAYELAKLGFTSVNIYQGGYPEWKTSGMPIEPEPKKQ